MESAKMEDTYIKKVKMRIEENKSLRLKHSSANAPFLHDRSKAFRSQPFHAPPFQHVPFCPLPLLSAPRSATKRLLWPQRSVLGQNKEEDNWMTHSYSSAESGLCDKIDVMPQEVECA